MCEQSCAGGEEGGDGGDVFYEGTGVEDEGVDCVDGVWCGILV